MPDWFNAAIDAVRANVWFGRLLVLAVYGLAARVCDFFVTRVLARLTARTKIVFDDLAVEILHAPTIWTVVAIGILHALTLPPPLSPPWHSVVPALVKSATVLVWGLALFRLLNRAADRGAAGMTARGRIGHDLYNLFHNLARVALIIAAVLWVLAIWRVNLTPMFASAGIAGIAVALAAKDTLANFFGGISIFADRTYKVGDYIIIDNSDRGEVVEIGIRSTRIKTRDDVLITIPNAILANAKIVNESAPQPRFRIRVPVGVAYDSDLDQVERVLLGVADATPGVVQEPPPRVRARALADSQITLELLCWIDDPAMKGKQTHDIIKAVLTAFREHGITIPFPQRDVHILRDRRTDQEG